MSLVNNSSMSSAKDKAQTWMDRNAPSAPEIASKPYFDAYDQMEEGQDEWAYWEEGGEQFTGDFPESKSNLQYELKLGG